ncbi:MAG TPA: hypothetical protein PK402_08165, partial [Tepidisphaeraceae bacterium]|nr:hypothetical protein [Tepidisphaeraceae bacterium]
FVAIVLTAGAVGNLARAINHGLFEALAEFIVGGIFALTAWIFTIRWLKYAIVGDHNFRKSKLIFKGRNENIKYE